MSEKPKWPFGEGQPHDALNNSQELGVVGDTGKIVEARKKQKEADLGSKEPGQTPGDFRDLFEE